MLPFVCDTLYQNECVEMAKNYASPFYGEKKNVIMIRLHVVLMLKFIIKTFYKLYKCAQSQ